MSSTRILLCNDHPIVRACLRLLLEREPRFHIVGEAATGREAMVLAEHIHPDVVLLDMQLPRMNGIIAAREILSKDKNVGIIFVTVHTDQEYVSEAFKAGARGYVLADSAPNDLFRSIQVVARGNWFLSSRITSQLIEELVGTHDPQRQQFSEYDQRLSCLLAEGFDDHELAAYLNASVDNVRFACRRVKRMMLQLEFPDVIRRRIEGLVPQ